MTATSSLPRHTSSFPRRRESNVLAVCFAAASLLAACGLHHERATVEHFPVAGDPEGKLPFADVVRAGNLLFQSGKLGNVPGTMQLVPGGIQAETRQTLENIKEGFARHGVSMDRVVKCTVFLADMKEWAAMNEIYVQFFPNGRPARSALGANGLALGARVEIECIAAL
jgi:2-iminobutanoate/2-iminopropanoate deaminase